MPGGPAAKGQLCRALLAHTAPVYHDGRCYGAKRMLVLPSSSRSGIPPPVSVTYSITFPRTRHAQNSIRTRHGAARRRFRTHQLAGARPTRWWSARLTLHSAALRQSRVHGPDARRCEAVHHRLHAQGHVAGAADHAPADAVWDSTIRADRLPPRARSVLRVRPGWIHLRVSGRARKVPLR